MSKVAVIVPWRPSEPRRATLWAFVRDWLRRYHGAWPVHTAPGPDGPFNRGAALNQAAAKTDADILVIHDADTICDPLQLSRAVTWVNNYGGICYPYETYTYLDQPSTDWIRSHPTGTWFVSPEVHHTQGFRTTVRHKHVSGAVVVSRQALAAVGGFIELQGWGAEDMIMHTLFETFVAGANWMQGGAYHLWHPAIRNDPNDASQIANHQILADVMSLSPVPDQLRSYLRQGGHPIPDER